MRDWGVFSKGILMCRGNENMKGMHVSCAIGTEWVRVGRGDEVMLEVPSVWELSDKK